MDDKLMHLHSNDLKQNYPFSRLNLLVEKFTHYLFGTYQSQLNESTQSIETKKISLSMQLSTNSFFFFIFHDFLLVLLFLIYQKVKLKCHIQGKSDEKVYLHYIRLCFLKKTYLYLINILDHGKKTKKRVSQYPRIFIIAFFLFLQGGFKEKKNKYLSPPPPPKKKIAFLLFLQEGFKEKKKTK